MRRSYRHVLALLLLLPLFPDALRAQSLPLTGRVVDRAEILGPAVEEELEHLLATHEDSTTNQVVVLTIRSLDGADIESYSLEIARSWGLGQAGRDNGVLLLVAVEDRQMRIEVGYGLEGDLTDAVAGRIIRNELRPFFQREDYEGGVLAGVRAILGAIEGSYAAEGDDIQDAPWLFRLMFLLMFILLPSFLSFTSAMGNGVAHGFLVLFFTPFIAGGTMVVTGSPYAALVAAVLFVVGHIVLAIYIRRSPKWRAVREKWKNAQKKGGKVKMSVFGHTFTVSPGNFSGGGSSSGRSSFSGGGGSFGGGGSSGSW